MPERASLFQGVQIGLESTPGTPVAAGKKLLAVSFEIDPNPDVSIFRPNGMKFPTIAALNREWVEGSINGQQSYTDLTYLFSSLIAKDTPATVGTTGKEWVFVSDSAGPDDPATFTIEQGSSVRAHRFANCLVNSLTLTFNNDGCMFDGEVLGSALEDGVTMTATPTEIALEPVMRKQVGVKFADTAAGLDAASFATRVLSAEWELSDRYSPLWTLNQSTDWDAFIEAEPSGEVRLLLAADAFGMGLLPTMRAGSTKFVRIQATGPVIGAGPATYELLLDTAIKITDSSPLRDEQGIFAIEWTGSFVHDSTWGKAYQVSLTNGLATL